MKLLTALIASVITLTPSIATASPLGNRQLILETFCSYSLLRVENRVEDCVEVAFEADARGYDVYAIKRTTDRFTAKAVGMSVEVVSISTSYNIEQWIARNR
jgi:hypothetical protein